jgi:hypothetical protein
MAMLVGNFEWGALCMPTVPWGKSTRKMPFFGRNDETPILVAVIMGLQHAFAMIGGESFLFFVSVFLDSTHSFFGFWFLLQRSNARASHRGASRASRSRE